jgi:hypothetical protein
MKHRSGFEVWRMAAELKKQIQRAERMLCYISSGITGLSRDSSIPSILYRDAVENRSRWRKVDGFGRPSGRRNGNMGLDRAIVDQDMNLSLLRVDTMPQCDFNANSQSSANSL